MSLIEPKRHILLKRVVKSNPQTTVDANRDIKLQEDTLIYVSLIDIIKNLLFNENYKKLLKSEKSNRDDILCSFEDGSLVKNNNLLKIHHSNFLKFLLYFDEMNVTDTASSRPAKMGMFYLIIGDIHPRHRSNLISINFLMEIESDLLKLFDFNDILAQIFDDLKMFENGVNTAKNGV